MDEEVARREYIQLKTLQEHAQKLQHHLSELDGKTQELLHMQEAVKDISQVEEGQDILVPLTNGIFITATAKKVERLHLNVGAQTVISKNPQDTLTVLRKQEEELGEYKQRLLEQQEQLHVQMEAVEMRVRKAMGE